MQVRDSMFLVSMQSLLSRLGFFAFLLAGREQWYILLFSHRAHLYASLVLSSWLEIRIAASEPKDPTKTNCLLTYKGQGPEDIFLDPKLYLITKSALYLLRFSDQDFFPWQTTIHIVNGIPLAQGLGLSGAAAVVPFWPTILVT